MGEWAESLWLESPRGRVRPGTTAGRPWGAAQCYHSSALAGGDSASYRAIRPVCERRAAGTCGADGERRGATAIHESLPEQPEPVLRAAAPAGGRRREPTGHTRGRLRRGSEPDRGRSRREPSRSDPSRIQLSSLPGGDAAGAECRRHGLRGDWRWGVPATDVSAGPTRPLGKRDRALRADADPADVSRPLESVAWARDDDWGIGARRPSGRSGGW